MVSNRYAFSRFRKTSSDCSWDRSCVVMPPARFSVMLADGESLVTLDKHSICRSIFSSVLVFPQRAVGDHCPTWLNLDSGLCLWFLGPVIFLTLILLVPLPTRQRLWSCCLPVCKQDYWKSNFSSIYLVTSRFHWNLVLWLGLPIGRTD